MKKSYSHLNLFLRSFCFSIFSITLIFFYSFFLLFTFILPLHQRYKIIRIFLKIYIGSLKWICHIDYKVEGLEHLAHIKNGIVLSKHQSTWETIFLPIIFSDPAIILKRELMWIPCFGWGIAASHPIAINRNNRSSAMQQIIKKGKEYLEAGRTIIMYPEGTRIAFGKIGEYRLGGARLAAATGYPVIPVAHNAGRFWPKRKFIKQPGTVRIVIGPIITSTDKTPEEILALTKNWIEATMLTL